MSSEAKLNEQQFLLEFLDVITASNKEKNYKNFTQLTGDPTAVMNKLMAGGGGVLHDLDTHQLALLVPQIRIFKVTKQGDKKDEKEFYFDDFTTLESIKESTAKRGQDVGLMSFTWNDMGTNPANSGFSFEASLKLSFQSFEGIFKKRNGVAFADLMSLGAMGRRSKQKLYDENSAYQIKAIVGWATPSDPGKKVFQDPTIINSTKTSLLLTLTTHDIDIKENGSVELTLNYIAALEGRMMGPKSDLLNVQTAPDQDRKERSVRRRGNVKKIVNEEKDRVKKQIEVLDNKGGWFNSKLTEEESDRLSGLKDQLKEMEKQTEKQTKDFEKLKKELSEAKDVARLESYSRLLGKILKDQRGFAFNLTPSQVEQYKALSSIKLSGQNKQRRKDLMKERSEYRQEILKEIPTARASEVAKRQADEAKKSTKLGPEKSKKKEKKERKDGTHVLNFFYFGDLIEAALQVLLEMKNLEGNTLVDPDKQFKFMLGSMKLPLSSGELIDIPLSDVPISLSVFNAWFQKNVIESKKDHFPFRAFIRKICSDLITSALNPASFGNFSKPSLTRVSISNFIVPKDSIKSGRVPIDGKEGVKRNLRQRTNLQNVGNVNQFLFLYVGGILSEDLKGDPKKDKSDGIYHFYVGAERGIVKKITFKRTDLPFHREARIENAKNSKDGSLLFSDVYHADVSMIGNPIFKPGMLVYINPHSMGITKKLAEQIGIGGYFLVIKTENVIESGRFETTMNLISQGRM